MKTSLHSLIKLSSKTRKIIIFYLLISFIYAGNISGQKTRDCLPAGNYQKDKKVLKARLKKQVKKFGESNSNVTQTQSELAELYQKLGKYDKAERLLKALHEATVKQYGNEYGKTAECQMQLAKIYIAKGEYLKAKKWSETALLTNKKITGESVYSSYNLNILAEVYQELGQYDKAKKILEDAIRININKLGNHHVAVAMLQSELALLYHTLGEHNKAQVLFEQLINSENKQYINIARHQSNLAQIYFQLGKYKKAGDALTLALETDLEILCEAHPKIARHRSNLSKVYFHTGEYKKAKNMIRLALRSNLKHYDNKHPVVIENYIDLAQTLRATSEENSELPVGYIPGLQKRKLRKKTQKTINILAKIVGFAGNLARTDSNTSRNSQQSELLGIFVELDSTSIFDDGLSDPKYKDAKLLWEHIIINTIKDIHQHCRLMPAEERLLYIQKRMEIFDTFFSFSTRHQDDEILYQISHISNAIKSIDLDYSRSLRRVVLQSEDKELPIY